MRFVFAAMAFVFLHFLVNCKIDVFIGRPLGRAIARSQTVFCSYVRHLFGLWQGDVGLPGLMGLPGEKGEKGLIGRRGRRVCASCCYIPRSDCRDFCTLSTSHYVTSFAVSFVSDVS